VAFEINKTELVWPGKYDADGNLVEKPRVSLPFQVIERVNETRATREAKKAEGLTLFDMWDGDDEGSTFEDGWRNKLIWGENSAVMSSLIEQFAGKIDLIYIDPPFDVGADFSVSVEVGGEDIGKQPSTMELIAYRDTWGKGENSFISMIAERLRLMRLLLSTNGAIYVHVDYRTSSFIKLLLDEVFGSNSFRGWLVWQIGTGAKGRKQWSNQHNDILCYSMSENFVFNSDDPDLREPFAELSSSMHFNKVDEDGRRYRERIVNGKSYIYYADEGKLVGSVWTDISSMAANSPILNESVSYPTQKPEKLLTRIIKASSNPGDLVADFFCGSGTTLAVAEKLGRRWIGADMGRYAVHTTRKRLLEIDKCKPFEVLNLGKYERQYWSTSHFGEDLDGDGQINLLEYFVFVLKLYGAEAISGSASLHGRKGNAYVHIGSVSSPVTIDEIETAVNECKQLGGLEVHVLGWEWEMGLHDPITGRAKQMGVKLVLRQIPREIMEAEAARKGQVKFFELAYLQAEVTNKKKGEYICELSDFSTPNLDLIPDEVREKIKKWSDYVDYWAVDWNYQNDTFSHGFVTYRTKQDRSLALKSDVHQFESPGKYQVMVKVIDIFGNDTSKIIEVTVPK
jgi:adenine-specific DNA-methyltransferase